MKIRNLKTKVIGLFLLSLPMACTHLGNGNHPKGDQHNIDENHEGYYGCYYRQLLPGELIAGIVGKGPMISYRSDSEDR